MSLAQIAPADLGVPILGQLSPTQLLLRDALEPGPLEVVRLDAALRSNSLRQEALEHTPRDPDHATLFADLDPNSNGLPVWVSAGVLRERDEHPPRLLAVGVSCI